MRVTNIAGAMFAFILAIAFDYALLVPMVNWCIDKMTGTELALSLSGILVVFGFITFIVPILIAQEDTSISE